jgi:hypothetical protein
VVRGGKRKDAEADSDKFKRQRAESASGGVRAGENCEGCGKPRHKRESCQLTQHPDYSEKGLWINSEGYKKNNAYLEASGKGDKHPELCWYEYASGGMIKEARFPGDKTKPDRVCQMSEDDDDIEWPEDLFDHPHRAESESPDELLALIQFAGTPALQEVLRALCREFIDIFSTAVRPLPAKVQSMVIEIDQTKWELPTNRLPQRHH